MATDDVIILRSREFDKILQIPLNKEYFHQS